jgi:hypothetical protein
VTLFEEIPASGKKEINVKVKLILPVDHSMQNVSSRPVNVNCAVDYQPFYIVSQN